MFQSVGSQAFHNTHIYMMFDPKLKGGCKMIIPRGALIYRSMPWPSTFASNL